MSVTVPVGSDVQESARESVDAKKDDGFGASSTTCPRNKDSYDDIAMTGALGEFIAVKWLRRCFPDAEISMKPVGHDYDLEIGGVSIDVKASAKKPRGRIKVQQKKIDSKDEQPDVWLRVDGVKSDVARVRGFCFHAGLTSFENADKNVYGTGNKGYVAGPESTQFVTDLSVLKREIAEGI